MLQGISWTTYLEATAALTAIYYAGVGVIFYKPELKALLTAKAKLPKTNKNAAIDETGTFEDLESIVHEIDGILQQAGDQATKAELLPQLRAKLASYGGLRQPAWRVAVINHIVRQAEEISGVRITEDELRG